MLISALEANNMYYYEGATPWALGWTCQKDVSTAEEAATGETAD